MAELFLIGGAPRVGKTTALKQLIAERPMLAASTDAIRCILRQAFNPDTHPSLFDFSSQHGTFSSLDTITRMRNDPWSIVELQNAESDIVWQSCVPFIESNLKDGHDIALEGVAVLPKHVAALACASNVQFLINTRDQTETILAHARNNPHDWLHGHPDDVISSFCITNQRQNEYFLSEATKLGLPYTEVTNSTYHTAIQQVVEKLLSPAN